MFACEAWLSGVPNVFLRETNLHPFLLFGCQCYVSRPIIHHDIGGPDSVAAVGEMMKQSETLCNIVQHWGREEFRKRVKIVLDGFRGRYKQRGQRKSRMRRRRHAR